MLAGAVGYGPRRGRFGLAAGVGTFGDAAAGYRGSRLGYGARFALTALRLADQRIAITPFAGFGSSRATLANAGRAGLPDSAAAAGKVIQQDEIPLGVAVGWRIAVGEGRAIALTAAPSYVIARRTGTTVDQSAANFRTAIVAELALSTRIGVVLATELGQTSSGAEPGARGSVSGAGLSYRLRR